MENGRALLLAGRLLIQATFLVMVIGMQFRGTSYAKANSHDLCSSSRGNIRNITSPFRLTTDPLSCGDLRDDLSCENNVTVIYLPVDSVHVNSYGPEYQRYYVQAINYNNYTIRLVDPDIQNYDFCSIPSNSLYHLDSWPNSISETFIFFTRESPVLNSSYIHASLCVFNRTFSTEMSLFRFSSKQYYSYYYIFDDAFESAELHESCWIEQTSLITKGHSNKKLTSNDIHNLLVHGFELSWMQSFATRHQSSCYVNGEDSNSVHVSITAYFRIAEWTIWIGVASSSLVWATSSGSVSVCSVLFFF